MNLLRRFRPSAVRLREYWSQLSRWFIVISYEEACMSTGEPELLGLASVSASAGGAEPDEAVAALHARCYRPLVRLAAALTDRDTAEDVVQDAFVKVWRRWRWIRDLDKAEHYLRRAVVNAARDRLRRAKVARAYQWPAEQTVDSAQTQALIAEEHRRVLAALARLPERQRHVIVLRYYGGLSEAETAATLGLRLGTVKSYAHRGLAKIREELA
jgi:RNA polymerase sigma-70 factor (sigma-E family)